MAIAVTQADEVFGSDRIEDGTIRGIEISWLTHVSAVDFQ
jgi:hypothetical protein